MSVTPADLEAFQRFAAQRLASQGAESMTELLREWESTRERRETIESVERGLADIEAGRTRPVADLLNDLRAGLSSQ